MASLITKSFASQCLAFPDHVDRALAEVETVEQAKGLLDQAATMQHYAERLKAGIAIERPIALGVLKIKAKLGELMPAKPPQESGAMKGKGVLPNGKPFDKNTLTAYRKLAANADRLPEYYDWTDDVPTQTDFIRFCGSDGNLATKFTGEMDWYTPAEYVEAARRVMGGIDLDPASSKAAQKTVRADKFYSASDDGLSQEWEGRVFLNPPYKMPLIEQFVFRLCDYVSEGRVIQAVLLTNNNTDTRWWHRSAGEAAAVCFTKGRIRFYNQAGIGSSPTNGQTFCYFGKRPAKFRDAFSSIGIVLCKM